MNVCFVIEPLKKNYCTLEYFNLGQHLPRCWINTQFEFNTMLFNTFVEK